MGKGASIERWFTRYFPSPFSLAVGLTLLTFALAIGFGDASDSSIWKRFVHYGSAWQKGLWKSDLLAFAVQMMLILVLGHCLALSRPVVQAIHGLCHYLRTPSMGVVGLSFITLTITLFNWGLGLIVGAVLTRQMAERFSARGIPFHYGLLGAAAYSGMMLWHGGLSGSAPLKAAEPGHLQTLANAPLSAVPLTETILNPVNLTAYGLCLVLIPGLFWLLQQRVKNKNYQLEIDDPNARTESALESSWSERSPWWGKAFGVLMLLLFIASYWMGESESFISLNRLNFLLFGLCLLLHQNIGSFLKAAETAMGGATGILLQFPLYFGILALLQESGLLHNLSQYIAQHSNSESFPFLSFLSAGLINIFVPSGGGQWSVQGPIIIDTCLQNGASLAKSIMAMSYGDQLTNMLQPFWALPLLGITRLKAGEILPYSALLFLFGLIFFSLVLILW